MAKPSNNRLIFILGGVILLLIIVAVIKSSSKPKGEKVTMEKVQKRTIHETVSASGKIFPETEVKISSDVSGEVVDLFVQEGDSVHAGQLLARINPDSYESAVERGLAGVNSSKAQWAQSLSAIESSRSQKAQSEAAKEQIEAQLNNARETHKRNEQLFKEGVISQSDFDASLSNLRSQEANLRSAIATIKAAESNIESSRQNARAAEFGVKNSEASLKELNTSLHRTSLYSPVNGIVSKLNVEKGERVVGTIQMSGTELMRIADLRTMEVQVDVNENEVMRAKLGNSVDVEVDAYIGRKFKGFVTEIASTASNATSATGQVTLTSDQVTNFVVKIRVDPDSYKDLATKASPYPFRPGMSASVDIYTNSVEEVMSIPIQSVTTREDKDSKNAKKVQVNNNDPNKKQVKKEDDIIKEVVFVHSADTVKMVEIKTGIQDDTYIQVLSGLKEGDEIVTGPYTAVSRKLKQGMKVVKVKEEELNGGEKKKDEEE